MAAVGVDARAGPARAATGESSGDYGGSDRGGMMSTATVSDGSGGQGHATGRGDTSYVTVLLFANARDLADGTSSVRVPLSNALRDTERKSGEGAFCVRDVVESLCAMHPALKDAFDDFAVALNEAIVGMDEEVRPNDTLAVLPPVSGG